MGSVEPKGSCCCMEWAGAAPNRNRIWLLIAARTDVVVDVVIRELDRRLLAAAAKMGFCFSADEDVCPAPIGDYDNRNSAMISTSVAPM